MGNYEMQIIDENMESEFNAAFVSRLNYGMTLGGTNIYFDRDGNKHYYAIFYSKIKKEFQLINPDMLAGFQ